MYDRFYNFTTEPFRLSPDHHFAYQHRAFKKARAYMTYAFMRAEGFVMVTGRPGTGKTTLVGAMIEELAKEQVMTANLVCSQLEARDLLQMVAYDFGVDVAISDKGQLLQHLNRLLLAWHRDGRRAVLIVDEAQDLSATAMEELRLLTNIQVANKPLLQIFLLGQPELRDLLLSPGMEQVHQRIVAASHLEPLGQDEAEAYVRHRLLTVGWQGRPAISRPVYGLVHRFSEGIPRRINLIFSRLLLHCAVTESEQVTVADLKEVIGELQNEKLAAGPEVSAADFRVADEFEPVEAVQEAAERLAAEGGVVSAQAAAGGGAASVVDLTPPSQPGRVVPMQAGPTSRRTSTASSTGSARPDIRVASPPEVNAAAGSGARPHWAGAGEPAKSPPTERKVIRQTRGEGLPEPSKAASNLGPVIVILVSALVLLGWLIWQGARG